MVDNKDKISIHTLVSDVKNSTHLELALAREAVLAAVSGMRFGSAGKDKVRAKIDKHGIELVGTYDIEDLTKNVLAGSQITTEQAVQVVSSVGTTISEHLSQTKTVTVDELGTFEVEDEYIYFCPPH